MHQELIAYMDIELQQKARKTNIQQIHVPIGCTEKRNTIVATYHVDLVHVS